jgi:hypothetical protein
VDAVKGELDSMWMEAVKVYFKVLQQQFPGDI